MRLGIDLGTTRAVVAAVDRGNYPVVGFYGPGGELAEWIPSRWQGVSSFKRQLGKARIGDRAFELACGFVEDLARALRTRANLELAPDEPLEAVIGVPANSSSTQRFLTVEAFRRAGFRVLAVVNEPSAAGLEYAHRYRKSITSVREHVVVYDLGGGTFDASLIDMGDGDHRVLRSEGIAELGGDDFDRVLFDLVAEKAGLSALSPDEERALLAECQLKKESILPQTRKIVIDLGTAGREGELVLSVPEVLERCEPLVQRTVDCLMGLFLDSAELESVAGVYVVGGASSLPVVGRVLREKFGRRVHRSQYSFASTAIGLAIAADAQSRYSLSDVFTRHFGVWREAEAGARAVFDPIFSKDTPLPPSGAAPLTRVRRYRALHNIGHFRFLECSHLGEGAVPEGDLMLRSEVFFPFDRALREAARLEAQPVARRADGPLVEERYECTPEGTVRFTVTSLDDGFSRSFDLV